MERDKVLQEKLILHKLIEARIESLLKQREALVESLMEIEETIKGIEELKGKSGDVFFSFGSATYIPAKVSGEDKIIVEIGANIALEKNLEEGKKILEKRKEEFSQAMKNLEGALEKLSSELMKVRKEIKEIVERGEQANV